MEHVLTIDLEEAPELAQRFPGARGLALDLPDPHGGEDYESSRLVAVPPRATPPATGEPLFVLPLDVPSAVFDHRASRANGLLQEVRSAVYNRSGWALGEPIWIQDDEGDCGLVMQLADRLGLNLGDGGSLYVFDGLVLMQSH
jgi:hypothetical protein